MTKGRNLFLSNYHFRVLAQCAGAKESILTQAQMSLSSWGYSNFVEQYNDSKNYQVITPTFEGDIADLRVLDNINAAENVCIVCRIGLPTSTRQVFTEMQHYNCKF